MNKVLVYVRWSVDMEENSHEMYWYGRLLWPKNIPIII